MSVLTDSFGREIDYLRLSVTDRCNLRCVYCLPERFSDFSLLEEFLTDDEMIRVLRIFVKLGISCVRITGGEPLVRPGICGLIERISGIQGIQDIGLTTNGVFMDRMAIALFRAGVKRVNISLDSLDPVKFRRITRSGRLEQVLVGIDAALAAGFSPVKINVVVARGVNDDEIPNFVSLTEQRRLCVRFIELMPMGDTGFFSRDKWVPSHEILKRAGPLQELSRREWPTGSGPARYFRRAGSLGSVGIISALSCGFCQTCNRARLSAKGRLFPCLDASEGTDLKEALRAQKGEALVEEKIRSAILRKPAQHRMLERAVSSSPHSRLMCQMGG